tara:strand:+ start:7428 stop:7610 length:183 start_codon:yes stop_codon:yes gene_type:complete
VRNGPIKVHLFDTFGHLVKAFKLDSGVSVVQMDLTGEPAGIYYLKVTTEKGDLTKIIIKQ